MNKIKIIFSNLVLLLLLFFLIEIGLRWIGYEVYPGTRPDVKVIPNATYFEKDSILGYRHLPGASRTLLKGVYEFTSTHDSLSKRITRPLKKDDNQIRPQIWIFGCSITYGWSINDHETFPWLLQEKLDSFDVVNWGVNGYGTIHFYLQLKTALENNIKPKMVIINNAHFHKMRNTFARRRRRVVQRWNFLGELNQPFAVLDKEERLHITQSDLLYIPWYLSRYFVLAEFCQIKYENFLNFINTPEQIKILKLILKEIIILCQENHIKLVMTNIYADDPIIKDFSTEEHIPYVDISVDLSVKGNTNAPYDSHPSAKANKVFSKKLYNFLLKESLLK